MRTAVFPGSFDPVTCGHMDLIQRASRMFDRLVIGILVNSAKSPLFTMEERARMLKELTKEYDNIEVCAFQGLLVDFVRQQNAVAIVRGLRSCGDFEYELPWAQANHAIYERADTVFLATAPEHSYISSSAVKELLRYQADVSGMVPEIVMRYIHSEGQA